MISLTLVREPCSKVSMIDGCDCTNADSGGADGVGGEAKGLIAKAVLLAG